MPIDETRAKMTNLDFEKHQVKSEEKTVDDGKVVGRAEADEDDNFESDEDSTCVSDKLYQADQQHFRSLLLDEIWRMILDEMKDSPEDMESCANASPYFRDLLYDQRVLFLFPKVLGILINHYDPTGWQVKRMTGKDLEEKPEGLIGTNEVQDKDKNLQEESTDEELPPGREISLEDISYDDNPDEDLPDEDIPDEDIPDEDLPDEDIPDEDIPDEDLPDEDIPDEDIPDADLPDEEVDNAVPLDSDDITKKKEYLKKWNNAVLKCREVCTKWKLSVEQCYEKPKSKFSINSILKAQSFMQHFETSHHSAQNCKNKNPFYRRYLRIQIREHETRHENHDHEFRNVMSRLLRMFGHEVWDLEIFGLGPFNDDYDHEHHYLMFREWLELMPNLKKIVLDYVYDDGLSQELVDQNPLPKLENLREILARERSDGTFVSEMIRKNSHIRTLDLERDTAIDENIGSLLSNLTDFSKHLEAKSATKMLERFGSRWKLNKLSLSDNFKEVFRLLGSNWKDTLTELELGVFSSGKEIELLKDTKDFRLNLPRLRQLSMNISSLMFLDFILPLANCLEHLQIYTYDYDPESAGFVKKREIRNRLAQDQVIQYAGFERKMHQSNIWKIFPKLTTIKMQDRWCSLPDYFVFTRKGEKLVYTKKKE